MTKYRVSHPGFYVFSVFSLAILLIMCGAMLSGLFFSDHYNKKFKEDISLLCELQAELTDVQVEETMEHIANTEGVREGSVEFVSREEALAEMYGDLGETVSLGSVDNPFSDMIEFAMNAESFTSENVERIAVEFERALPIRQVHYPDEYFDDVFGVLTSLRSYLWVAIFILLAMTVVLIHHIMRLNVVAQSRQIRTMELVGAEPKAIRSPFIRLSRRMSVQAWGIAALLTAVGWYLVLGGGGFIQWAFSMPAVIGLAALFAIAFAVCVVSTRLAVSKIIGSTILQGS